MRVRRTHKLLKCLHYPTKPRVLRAFRVETPRAPQGREERQLAAPLAGQDVLARLGTIEAQLSASGVEPQRKVLDFGFIRAPKHVRAHLDAETVLQIRRLNLADGAPFARVTVWVPEDLAGELSRAVVERSTLYDNLPVEVGGATQTIGAAAASESDAQLLEIPVGSPVLRCERLTHAVDGRPVLYSEFVFPAHRTEFVVDLPHAEASIAPTGLRLVE